MFFLTPLFKINQNFFYRYKETIDDCNLALQLDVKSTKAYYRRMEANIALQNYKLALEDGKKLVQLVPKDTNFKAKLEYLKQKVSESEKERGTVNCVSS